MKKALPIGISDFAKIRDKGYYYVDKTLMIADLLRYSAEVTLITRPRRFGKTLNMTMLREFFDITRDSKALFADLAISQTTYSQEMNQWPVIFLSFKDCKNEKETMVKCLYRQLLSSYQQAYHCLKPDEIDSIRLNRIMDVLANEKVVETSSVNDCIYFLSKLLYQYYGKKVIILIDEYDTPMINAYERGYYEEVRSLFSSLYGTALKDNPYLERAMLTGIHRIARENIFSGLNNLDVCTVMDNMYSQYFGLTPEETKILLEYYDLVLDESVRAMYDGYRFGEQEIYNPWSIINYARNKKMNAYWANTASNELLVQAMLDADKRTQENFERLLTEGQAIVTVDLQTSFFEINKAATLWGLFLNSGYLTIPHMPEVNDLQTEVRIPNQEVMSSFRKIIERYGGFDDSILADLFGALLRKDFSSFQAVYEQIILNCTSFHDGSSENAYHMLFLGMCVYLSGDYQVRSNIESGHGRADIVLAAKRPGKPNFVIEFKQGEPIEQLAKEALEQIQAKAYDAGLEGETILLGIAHDLKHCQIVSEIRQAQ